MGRKCSVEGCLSDTNRPEDVGVTFHKVPMHPDVRPKWFSLCHIPEDKKLVKVIYICSRHFLRADFCNFKGKKYMLRQGVLPSVFPWDKSKLEAIKAEASIKKEVPSEVVNLNVKKEENKRSRKESKSEPKRVIKLEPAEVENQVVQNTIKEEPKEKFEEFEKSKLAQTSTSFMNFTINSRIEALDFNNEWYPARIVEVDYEENEVLIHFEKFSSKYDEWICMNSSRLRPLQTEKGVPIEQYTVGERCLAVWSGGRKFPATVTKVMEHDTYEVLFDDGFVKTLKAHRMSKAHGKVLQSAPLFDPIKSSKQDRRDKKRKLNVASLFRKRPRVEHAEDKAKKQAVVPPAAPDSLSAASISTGESNENWIPHWYKGKPVGTDSTIETSDGPRNSVIVPDPRLPIGWNKHLVKKSQAMTATKWDSIIVSPDSRKFRSKTDIRNYIEQNPHLELNEQMFDFSVTGRRRRRAGDAAVKKVPEVEQQETPIKQEVVEPSEPPLLEEANVNSLKILFEDDAYKCPIEGCGKNFRRENLAQMHVKHYHPEYTKFLDSTPNVADLAYARTVGENLDKSPGPSRAAPLKPVIRTSTPKAPKLPHSPLPETSASKPQSPSASKSKDTEIIKLLSTKPFDKKEAETAPPSTSGLPASAYPDIKLKDLLTKSEGMPKRDDINVKTLCGTRPPAGIRTLLPVLRLPTTETCAEDAPKHTVKRKRGISENVEIIKGKETQQFTVTSPSSSSQSSLPAPSQFSSTTPLETLSQQQQPPPPPPPSPPNDIIIEGGEIIKIVRMRQEEIINCTCGFTEEDGLMIQCELCLCWQHAYCNNIERESQVPEKYICYICQHPLRERASRKYYHDQDWMKQGTLPTGSYHSRDEDSLQKRFEKLKKSHDLSGALLELREYMHSLSIKMKIAEAKNHPKLYLWSKPWEKRCLPEKIKQEGQETKPKIEDDDHQYIKNELDLEKQEPQHDSMLMMILKAGKEVMPKLDLNSLMDNNMGQLSAPIIPQPEAAIDSTDCRLNLLEHIIHQESLVETRLDEFEKQIVALEEGMNMESDPNYPKTRQSLQMLVRDLGTLKEFSHSTTL